MFAIKLKANSLITISIFRFCRLYGSDVRVRFAPSPTGFMHLGGLRTALYNYLLARKLNGKFILRIEDTDQKRVKVGSVENINSMLHWAGLIPDESPAIGGSFGPYMQSQRLSKYQEKARDLIESGAAYRCFCSETRLDILRRDSLKNNQNRGYDNKCRHLTPAEVKELLSQGTSFTIRFKIPDESVTHNDVIFGKCTYNIAENEGDFIIMKSDGYPTYHFACVIDDHLMEISHVLRGTEWLISTPKHIMMFHAFGWQVPKYAHLPLLINSDRTKLSKRQASIGVEHFKNKGYSPEALLNFLAAAGGGFGKQEGCIVYDLDTLCSKFELENMNTNSCIVDLRKLEVFNHNYLAKQFATEKSIGELIEKLRSSLKQKYGKRYEMEEKNLPNSYMKKVLLCYKDRMNNLLELMQNDMEYLFTSTNVNDILLKLSELKIEDSTLDGFEIVMKSLSNLPDSEFTKAELSSKIKEIATQNSISFVPLMRGLRVVLTGQKEGPGVGEILFMLGKERSLEKIETAVIEIKSRKQKTKSVA